MRQKNMTQEPLIYTSKGNVPISSVTLQHAWRVTPEAIVYREFYTDNTTGEIVKDSTAVYIPQGSQTAAQAGTF